MTDLTAAKESPPIPFEITEAHMRVLVEMSARQTFHLDKPTVPLRTRVWAGVIVAASVVGLLAAIAAIDRRALPTWCALVPVLTGAAGATKFIDDRAKRRRAADRWVESVLKSTLTGARLGRYTVRIDGAGVSCEGPIENRHVRWNGVYSFTVHNRFVFISLGWEAISVPVEAFVDVGGAQAFVDFGNRRLGEEGLGIQRAMLDYFARSAAACKGCRYSLRGVASLICPECGRVVEPSDFPEAWQRG